MLLEEGGAETLGSWEETGKKKKKKNQEDEKAGKENEDWNDDFDPNNKFDDNRSRQRGPPRLRSRGGPGQGPRGEEGWKARENQENDRNNFEGGRGRGRGGLGPRGGRGGGVARGAIGGQRGGRGGGPRGGFSDRGQVDPRLVERREPPVGQQEQQIRAGGEGSFGQIETWAPEGGQGAAPGPGPVQQPGAPGGPERRPRPGGSKDAFDNAGNWGDDFPAAEDWDNDEYTGSLSDTKVFTPSGAAGPKPSAIGEPVNGEARPQTSHPQASVAQPTPANNSLSGSSYSQPIDISALLQKPGGLTGAAPSAALSQYQQAATKDLKSAIGLAPGSGSLSYSSGSSAPGSSFSSAAPGSAFSPIKPAAVTNGSTAASKALPRARLPPPSKIPSSAVEMPGDSLVNLDVQFGGLDLQFGGSNNENNSSNFDFGAGSPPNPKQELEKERFSSIPAGGPGKQEQSGPSLDSYKAQGQAVGQGKEQVPQSLTSALASAGIKPSSSSDSVPGYGRVGERETPGSRPGESKPQSYSSSQQRSPGPLLTKGENLGYSSNGQSYGGSQGYPGKATSQGFPSGGYPGSGFERQQSSGGYSNASNGLSSGYGGSGRGGGTSGYNPPREASYGNSYSSNTGQGSNFGGAYGASTTQYSPYSTSNSYSKAGGQGSQFQPASTSSSQYTADSSTTQGSKPSFESSQTSTTSSSGYGGVGASSTSSGLGLGTGGMVSSGTKMSVNTTSGSARPAVPGMPPGVPGVLPAQYMIGANAAAAAGRH